MKIQAASFLACVSMTSLAFAGEGTIMRFPGEVSSGSDAQIMVIKITKKDFETLRDEDEAKVAGTDVQTLRLSSSEVLEGETVDGRPVVLLKSAK